MWLSCSATIAVNVLLLLLWILACIFLFCVFACLRFDLANANPTMDVTKRSSFNTLDSLYVCLSHGAVRCVLLFTPRCLVRYPDTFKREALGAMCARLLAATPLPILPTASPELSRDPTLNPRAAVRLLPGLADLLFKATTVVKLGVPLAAAGARALYACGGHLVIATWCGVWCGVVWCGVVWCGVVWCGVVQLELYVAG